MFVVLCFLFCVATAAIGQAPVITSFQGNGELTWTNAVNTDAVYRIEWAARAGGPWYRTMQGVMSVDAHGSTNFGVAVPMFYRVAMVTNEAPRGMVWIEGGDFIMGDASGVGNDDEKPIHTNAVSGFWMDEMEVVKWKWDDVRSWALTNGYTFSSSDCGQAKTNSYPVGMLSWFDAAKWCNARSAKEGLTPCYYTDASMSMVYTQGQVDVQNSWVNWGANGYRLPTEAEWEKAARGGRQKRMFPWGGDTVRHARANYFSSTETYDVSPTKGCHPLYFEGVMPYAGPAGSFPANAFGLHDMSGNVREWCWDWYGADYYGSTPVTDPKGPTTGSARVCRGGSWWDSAFSLRCAYRGRYDPTDKTSAVGFRCVRKE